MEVVTKPQLVSTLERVKAWSVLNLAGSMAAASNALTLKAANGTTVLSTITAANLVTVLGNTAVNVASKLGTATKGSATKPIYLSSGTPTACTDYAGGTNVTLNHVAKSGLSADIYAETSGGIAGQILVAGGANTAPAWSSVIQIDATNERVGINNPSPTVALDVDGAINVSENASISGDTTLANSSNKKVYLGGSGTPHTGWTNGQYLTWDNDHKAWHLVGNLYADGFISAGGLNDDSGSSVDLPRVWQSLTNSDSPVTPDANTKIALAHIPDITVSKISNIATYYAAIGGSSSHDFATQNLSVTGNITTTGAIIKTHNGTNYTLTLPNKTGTIALTSDLSIKNLYTVVDSLPTASSSTMGKIYLVPSSNAQTTNAKDEYITIDNGAGATTRYTWEQIGSTEVDLSTYWQNSNSTSSSNYLIAMTTGSSSDTASTTGSLYAILNYYFPISA